VPRILVLVLFPPYTTCALLSHTGASILTDDTPVFTASASSILSPLPLPIADATREPGVRTLADITVSKLEPMLSIFLVMSFFAPSPMEIMAMTAPTPIITPSIASTLRSLLAISPSTAIFMFSHISYKLSRPGLFSGLSGGNLTAAG